VPVNFDGAAIVEVLARHDVRYVLIGGFAAVAQGSPIPTTDVDIVPARDPDNYARLSDALRELDAKVRAAGVDPLPFSHDADSLAAVRVWNLTTKYGDLDVTVEPSGTHGYDDRIAMPSPSSFAEVASSWRRSPTSCGARRPRAGTRIGGRCRCCASCSPVNYARSGIDRAAEASEIRQRRRLRGAKVQECHRQLPATPSRRSRRTSSMS